jgi:hypothetical protein
MNEELKIKISVDTGGVDTGVARAKKSLKSLSDTTKASMKGATVGATEGFEELRNSIDQIRNLQFGEMIGKQLDKVSGHAKLAAQSFSNLFSVKYWKGAKENIHSFSDLIGTIGTEGKEAWTSFKTAGKAALDAIHIKLIAVIAAVAALGAAIKNAFSTASQIKALNNEAAKIGLSVNAYQEWSYIMEKTGSDAGVLGDAIKTLSAEQLEVRKGTEDAIAKFEALGLSMETVMNMSQEELLTETVKRLQNVRNEVERTSLAYRIFGEEDAAQMANVLRLTNAETADMAATVHLLGNTISGELLTKSRALSGAVSSMKMAWQGLTNTLAELFMPVLTTIVNGLTKALVVVNLFLKTIFGLDMTPALSGIGASAGNIGALTDGLTGAGDAANAATVAIDKLRRVTMGFDELNIVSNPNTASSGGDTNSGSGAGKLDFGSGFTETEGAFDKAKGKLEEFQKKIEDFLNKWKTQIQIIAAALGALGVANLITGLGKAIGLGDKFLGIMTGIKKLAGTAIVITLQYSAISEFMDSYIDGEGFKNYVLGLVSAAIGTGILYAMWGPAGAVVGLGVTAVASLNTVFENGGITNAESATVALTAFASAVGAVGLAFAKLKGLSFGALVAPILAAIKGLWTEAQIFTKGSWLYIVNSVKTALAALPGLISGAWSNIVIFVKASWAAFAKSAGAALVAAKGAITTALGAIKTAVVTVIKFIIANPIALVIAAIVALVALIATKGDEIQKALNKVSDWLKNIFVKDWRNVFGNTLGTIMNGAVKIVGDILGNTKKILNGLIDFIRGVFTGNWRRAWDGIKSIFSGVFNGLIAVAKAPINAIITLVNGMLSGITSGFNAVKRALNKLSIKIPSWVPEFGGKTFGFNFSMSTAPKIPMLATGGIITGDTIARLGENGKKEAVLPLEQNTGWMDMLADRLASRIGGDTKVVLQVGEKELGWATINSINGITKQTGGLQLHLV